ncbi:ArsR/SmtB family transcription factor [Pseudoroseicyclus aestuarii]|uniref:ArsR family transcriptional regulator n=1 Tax=Pseudoroseicyclus aestuarii TaxID=1795041 RepID=A0A318T4F0_9RHOB|nr:helix-turn-helix domain-containing protein [Pseudoroseicyclus aestuarii]PYE81398.1 ArsR family transcriptional regulator [Pseudoroseicyclus aestuarii]
MTSGPELPHPARDEIALTQVLFALSDPDRLAIVRQLAGGPLEMKACTPGETARAKSTRSHLFKVLREAGVLRSVPQGRGRLLTLRRADLEARFPGLLQAVLDGAD